MTSIGHSIGNFQTGGRQAYDYLKNVDGADRSTKDSNLSVGELGAYALTQEPEGPESRNLMNLMEHRDEAAGEDGVLTFEEAQQWLSLYNSTKIDRSAQPEPNEQQAA